MISSGWMQEMEPIPEEGTEADGSEWGATSDGGTGKRTMRKKEVYTSEQINTLVREAEDLTLECNEELMCNYKETCVCTPGGDEANCQCEEVDLYKILEHVDHKLPIITGKYQLAVTKDKTPVLRMRHNQVHLKNMNHHHCSQCHYCGCHQHQNTQYPIVYPPQYSHQYYPIAYPPQHSHQYRTPPPRHRTPTPPPAPRPRTPTPPPPARNPTPSPPSPRYRDRGCNICRGNHIARDCYEYEAQDRLRIIKSQNRCVICLNRKNHSIQACKFWNEGNRYLCKRCPENAGPHSRNLCVSPHPAQNRVVTEEHRRIIEDVQRHAEEEEQEDESENEEEAENEEESEDAEYEDKEDKDKPRIIRHQSLPNLNF
ncbi:hypothetical protein CRE_26885 [Caenorhabditis remanei]|uniref:Phlebovirus glycoprotein G2 fusion domain-containing protein n=1 Tax=Caenorhabditis remanei TaxID=31234 RepID=E3NQY2_CAERE|nr:hypothetical protein CRE_26885 [Caenorhabditis remanei]